MYVCTFEMEIKFNNAFVFKCLRQSFANAAN